MQRLLHFLRSRRKGRATHVHIWGGHAPGGPDFVGVLFDPSWMLCSLVAFVQQLKADLKSVTHVLVNVSGVKGVERGMGGGGGGGMGMDNHG